MSRKDSTTCSHPWRCYAMVGHSVSRKSYCQSCFTKYRVNSADIQRGRGPLAVEEQNFTCLTAHLPGCITTACLDCSFYLLHVHMRMCGAVAPLEPCLCTNNVHSVMCNITARCLNGGTCYVTAMGLHHLRKSGVCSSFSKFVRHLAFP